MDSADFVNQGQGEMSGGGTPVQDEEGGGKTAPNEASGVPQLPGLGMLSGATEDSNSMPPPSDTQDSLVQLDTGSVSQGFPSGLEEVGQTYDPGADLPNAGIENTYDPNADLNPTPGIENTYNPSADLDPSLGVQNTFDPNHDIAPTFDPVSDINPTFEPSEVNTFDPSADIPGTYDPSADIPSTYNPDADISDTYNPNADIPSTYNPNADISDTYNPNADIPSTYNPNADIPSTYNPNADIPSTYNPNADIPSTYNPNADISDTYNPNTDLPSATFDPNADLPSATFDPNMKGVVDEKEEGEDTVLEVVVQEEEQSTEESQKGETQDIAETQEIIEAEKQDEVKSPAGDDKSGDGGEKDQGVKSDDKAASAMSPAGPQSPSSPQSPAGPESPVADHPASPEPESKNIYADSPPASPSSSRSGSRSRSRSPRSRSGSRKSDRSRSRSGSPKSVGRKSGSPRSRSRSRSPQSARSRSGSPVGSRSGSPAGSRSGSPAGSRSGSPKSGGGSDSEEEIGVKKKRRVIASDSEGSDAEEETKKTKPEEGEGPGSDAEGEGEGKGGDLIQDIFGAPSDDEFEGFQEDEVEKTKQKTKKEGEQSDGEEKAAASDSDDPGVIDSRVDDRPDNGNDFEAMLARKKAANPRRRKRKGGDAINDNDDLISEMIMKMREAAEEDRQLNVQRKPAVKKLRMLDPVVTQLEKADLHAALLDGGILTAITDWLAPLPDKNLPHLKIRENFLRLLATFPLVNPDSLKSSGIGKAVMYLYKHPREVKKNKERAGKLINEWSRPIFNLESNFKSMKKEDREDRDYQHLSKKRRVSSEGAKTPRQDIGSAMAPEKEGKKPGEVGFVMRARVPMPSTRDYVVRPRSKVDEIPNRKPTKRQMNRYEKTAKNVKDKMQKKKGMRAVTISLEGKNMTL